LNRWPWWAWWRMVVPALLTLTVTLTVIAAKITS
jgi:hypothetical protein